MAMLPIILFSDSKIKYDQLAITTVAGHKVNTVCWSKTFSSRSRMGQWSFVDYDAVLCGLMMVLATGLSGRHVT